MKTIPTLFVLYALPAALAFAQEPAGRRGGRAGAAATTTTAVAGTAEKAATGDAKPADKKKKRNPSWR